MKKMLEVTHNSFHGYEVHTILCDVQLMEDMGRNVARVTPSIRGGKQFTKGDCGWRKDAECGCGEGLVRRDVDGKIIACEGWLIDLEDLESGEIELRGRYPQR